MNEEIKNTENRLLAALSHGSIIAQGIGILVGILVYITQRDKSRYAAFQSLQAAVFQFISFIIMIGMWVIWGACYGLSMIPLIIQVETNPNAAPPAIFWLSLMGMVIPIIYMTLAGVYGLWGALRTWQGKDFRYLFLGSWLEKSGLWSIEVEEAPL